MIQANLTILSILFNLKVYEFFQLRIFNIKRLMGLFLENTIISFYHSYANYALWAMMCSARLALMLYLKGILFFSVDLKIFLLSFLAIWIKRIFRLYINKEENLNQLRIHTKNRMIGKRKENKRKGIVEKTLIRIGCPKSLSIF